jgi:pimeloyl-ACP methyl ester carboxylesterase
MKTMLSSSFAVCLSLGFFGCAGSDDAQPTGASKSAPSPAPETTSEPIAPSPAAVLPEEPLNPSVAATPEDSPESTPTPGLVATSGGAAQAQPLELRWRACGQFDDHDLECAELEVPVDYSQPEGEKLLLAVRRIQADPFEPYRGALLFNPGGPGGEGIDSSLNYYEGGVFDEIAPGFDIIGFDPRGVAASGERGCGILPPDMYPDMATAPQDLKSALADYVAGLHTRGEQCEKAWGTLFRQLGSNNVVRDMEEIRKALQEPVLNFYGASYGTRLGALYAHAYPQTTGRIVLDAPEQPRANFVELVRGQFHQAIALHEQLLANCESAKLSCPVNARQVFDRVLANADTRGVKESFVSAWRSDLDSPVGVQRNVAALAAEAANPGGDWIVSFLGGGRGGSGISEVPYFSVNCTDDAVEPPTIDEIVSVTYEFGQASPLFAGDVLSVANCTGWPTTRDPVPLPTATEGRPLLVIGGTQDMRTPYPFAQAMTEALGNATLLTSNHYGHGAVGWGGDCVRQNVRAYLTSGSMPATGATCP